WTSHGHPDQVPCGTHDNSPLLPPVDASVEANQSIDTSAAQTLPGAACSRDHAEACDRSLGMSSDRDGELSGRDLIVAHASYGTFRPRHPEHRNIGSRVATR